MTEQFDAIAVGAGLAGIAFAGRLAAEGKRVALIETGQPAKTYLAQGNFAGTALAESASAAWTTRHAARFGLIGAGPARADMRAIRQRAARQADAAETAMTQRLGGLRQLTRIAGAARFTAPDTIAVGKRRLSAPHILLDIGLAPVLPNWPGLKSIRHFTAANFADIDSLPDHLIVVGASAAGLEFAQIHARFGAKVSVIEAGPRPLPGEDEEAATALRTALEAEGVSFLFNTEVDAAEHAGFGVLLSLRSGKRLSSIEGSHLLLCPPPLADTKRLDLAQAGIEADEDGFVAVDQEGNTSVAGIRAAGPGTIGVQARLRLLTDPPFIRLGLTPAQLRRAGRPALVATSRQSGAGGVPGLIRLLADKHSGEWLGATLLGPDTPVQAALLEPSIAGGTAPGQMEAHLARLKASFKPLK